MLLINFGNVMVSRSTRPDGTSTHDTDKIATLNG